MKKNTGIAVGILGAIGGLEHVAQAFGSTLLTLPVIDIAPAVVQGAAGAAVLYLAYLASGKYLK